MGIGLIAEWSLQSRIKDNAVRAGLFLLPALLKDVLQSLLDS